MSLPTWSLVAWAVLLQYWAEGKPLIIAHRGSPCSIPEETIAGYQAAAEANADYLEMDVVMSRDGTLICRHDITLDDSTNAASAEEFAKRRRTELLPGGQNLTGVFASDLTIEEILELKARQVMPFRDHFLDDRYTVPTLQDVLRFAKPLVEAGKVLGVYIETKQPSWHESISLPMEQRLLDVLDAEGWFHLPPGAVVLQSFEPESLRRMHGLLQTWQVGRANFTWLMNAEAPRPSDADLQAFATYGHFIGPDKAMVAELVDTPECEPRMASGDYGDFCAGRLAQPVASGGAENDLVQRAHAQGLGVHTYTHRNEDKFMALDFRSDPAAELQLFAGKNALGVDGIFVDCPATAAAWRSLEYKYSPLLQSDHANTAELQKPCAQSDWSTAIISFFSVIFGWAGCRYLLPWLAAARQRAFQKYHRLSDGEVLRNAELTARS